MMWKRVVVIVIVVWPILANTVPPVVLFPGFASTQLLTWSRVECQGVPSSFPVGSRVWLNLPMIVGAHNCWMNSMKLDPLLQRDIGSRTRPGEDLIHIYSIEQGLGAWFSVVWGEVIDSFVENLRLDPGVSLLSANYDWRLPPHLLQGRDNFMQKTKSKIETAVRFYQNKTTEGRGMGAVIIAHSMGNNVFRYFISWILRSLGPFHGQEWIDKYIGTYFAVGSPFLGSTDGTEALLYGQNFGLFALSCPDARELALTFGSAPWNLPYFPPDQDVNTSPWEMELTKLRFKESWLQKNSESTKMVEKSYNGENIFELFKDISIFDESVVNTTHMLDQWYFNDSVLNPFSVWTRPPIKKIYCAYGINVDTRVSVTYQSDEKGKWEPIETFYESTEGHYSDKDEKRCSREVSKSGDGTVPYASLSWCHNWFDENHEVKELELPKSIVYSRGGGEVEAPQKITFFEQTFTEAGKEQSTAVWEIEGR